MSKFSRFEIFGYTSQDFKGTPTVFTAQLNPESFDRIMEFTAAKQKTRHKSGQDGKETIISGEKYRLDLVLDGTGAVDLEGKGDISTKVNEFLNAIYFKTVDQKSHKEGRKPRFLKMYYCNEIHTCIISSLTIKYSLFSRDGKPLRAKLTCEFSSVGFPLEDDKKKEELENRKKAAASKEELARQNGDVEKMKESAYEKNYNTIHPAHPTPPVKSAEPVKSVK